jgi:AcrR family transcriptional regulator
MAGRPRSFDRDAALSVATETFWREGYDGTSISSLVRTVGIAPPSLYAAFGDKATLFGEAAAGYVANLREQTELCLAEPSARKAIERLLVSAARAHTDPRTPPGCLVFSEPRLAHERAWVMRRIRERLNDALKQGELPAHSDPSALANLVQTVLSGMSERARDGASTEDLIAVAQLAASAVTAAPRP